MKGLPTTVAALKIDTPLFASLQNHFLPDSLPSGTGIEYSTDTAQPAPATEKCIQNIY